MAAGESPMAPIIVAFHQTILRVSDCRACTAVPNTLLSALCLTWRMCAFPARGEKKSNEFEKSIR